MVHVVAEGGDHEGELLGGRHARAAAGQPNEAERRVRHIHAMEKVVVRHLPVLVAHLRAHTHTHAHAHRDGRDGNVLILTDIFSAFSSREVKALAGRKHDHRISAEIVQLPAVQMQLVRPLPTLC